MYQVEQGEGRVGEGIEHEQEHEGKRHCLTEPYFFILQVGIVVVQSAIVFPDGKEHIYGEDNQEHHIVCSDNVAEKGVRMVHFKYYKHREYAYGNEDGP